jgi:hypothetical protein
MPQTHNGDDRQPGSSYVPGLPSGTRVSLSIELNCNSDEPHVYQPGSTLVKRDDQASYYVAAPEQLLDDQSNLIDLLISFAFDTLSAWRLDVRICAAES